ncbi:MAG: ATP-binding protein [Chloroflexi bacterium]|nr:ATP-binding protein [Chloroflexota bacterium]
MSELVTRRLPLIGRKEECQVITEALRDRKTQVLFLEGVAGIGKTVILEQAERIAQEHRALCIPIVDFYDTEMHAHRALEATIARGLDPERKAFREYWARREQMERSLLPERKRLKEQQEELWEYFLEGYRRVAKEKRVVLRFDTAERLEYGRDSEDVLKDCEVLPEDAPSWEWFLEHIGDLKNTAVLIASRPMPTNLLKQRLLGVHKGRVQILEVQAFTLEEVEAYFRATDFGSQVADEYPEMVGKVHLLTDGRPILIALALDWLERGMWERRIYPTSLEELQALKNQAQEDECSGRRGEAWQRWNEIKRGFESALVQQIRSLEPTSMDVAVKYAAIARKGCNAAFLSRLMRVSLEEAEGLVEQLLALSFVKLPRGPRRFFFLHDEMYDLVEKYIWLVDWPDYSEQARLDRIIIDWYTEQIKILKERIKACLDWRERAILRHQQQLLIVERLYYQFDEDPRLGYLEYSHLDEEAIRSRYHALDIWLRNEALWFTFNRYWRKGKQIDDPKYPRRDPAWMRNGKLERSPAVDHDCRRRWINRYIARNEMEKAVRVAGKLLQKSRESPHPEEPELYRPGVQIALATAQAYMGGEFLDPALQNFQESMQCLGGVPQGHREYWLYPYLLASAILYRGLALRGSLWLDEAALAYGQATYHYRSIGFQPGLAEAMNNLAYVHARQGRLMQALASCEEALHIRRELGDEYDIGLSLNTKGIINERMDRPLTAIHNSGQALALFRELNNERGIILAEINLGRSYRRKARSPEWGRKDEDFETGVKHLEDAIYRQEQMGASADMFYRVEACNELGCLYRDWVATLFEKGMKDNGRVQEFLESAESYVIKAIDLTTEKWQVLARHVMQHVDSLEDLARVYYWRGKLGFPVGPWAVQHGIDRSLQAMESLLGDAKKLVEQYLKESEELLLIMGKIHHQYARLARERAEEAKEEDRKRNELSYAAKHYAWAAASLERYSFDAPELCKTVSDACEWLCMLQPEEAQERIEQMYSTLRANRQESRRLRQWVGSVVYPRIGVGWPVEEREVDCG